MKFNDEEYCFDLVGDSFALVAYCAGWSHERSSFRFPKQRGSRRSCC